MTGYIMHKARRGRSCRAWVPVLGERCCAAGVWARVLRAHDRALCAMRPEARCDLAPEGKCSLCGGPEAFLRDDGACELCARHAAEMVAYALGQWARARDIAPWCGACRKVIPPGAPRRVVWSTSGVYPGGVQIRCEACAAKGWR